jgi:peptidoglycan hydrolase CwlO-like protein
MKKSLLLLLLACGLCFSFSGCGVDELKKEVENKNKALSKCEAEKADINKKVQELKTALSAKDADIAKAQAAQQAAEKSILDSNAGMSAAKTELEAAKTELAAVQAQLKECTEAGVKKPKKK